MTRSRGSAGHAGLSAARVTAVIILMLVAAAAAAVFLMGLGWIDVGLIGIAPLETVMTGEYRLAVTAGAAATGVIAIAIAVRKPGRGESATTGRHIVTMGERGIVVVNSASVSALAAAAVRQQAGVLDAEIRVRGTGAEPVRLLVRATVMPGTSVAAIGAGSQDAARGAVERLAGLTVRDVNVEVLVAVPSDLSRVLE